MDTEVGLPDHLTQLGGQMTVKRRRILLFGPVRRDGRRRDKRQQIASGSDEVVKAERGGHYGGGKR